MHGSVRAIPHHLTRAAVLVAAAWALLLASAAPALAAPGDITTIAGTGVSGSTGDGGPATAATLGTPTGVAVDAAGNVYVADPTQHRVRRIDTSGIITTFAGNGLMTSSGDGGPATAASLRSPFDVAVDAAGNLYISEADSERVRRVDASGVITTVAGGGASSPGDGGPAVGAALTGLRGITVDPSGALYLVEWSIGRIRRVDPGGTITTVAGTGTVGFGAHGIPPTTSELFYAWDVMVDAGGRVLITERFRVRAVDGSGTITTVAGTGIAGFSGDGGLATSAAMNLVTSLADDGAGGFFLTDLVNAHIRRVNSAGVITTVAGTGTPGFSGDGGPATAAQLHGGGLALTATGDLVLGDELNRRVRLISEASPVPALAGGPWAVLALLGAITGAGALAVHHHRSRQPLPMPDTTGALR